ncbi:MAG: hypothetical protein HQL34_13010, partial [Alphaproteobacteria bacterium]|nr:hypothetical protein [Alphaproteobacteria bacterium]
AMLAKSERAAVFRSWVLDVLEAKARPSLQGELSTALARRLRVVARHVLRAQPDWRRIIGYKRRGLSNAEIAKLMDHGPDWVRKALREMEAFGLVEPPADLPVRRAQAIVMRRALPVPAAMEARHG